MRRPYDENPALWPSVLRLLSDAFPGFAEAERLARAHGLDWETASVPFVHEEDGEVVSHVGVLRLPLVVAGRRIAAAGIHAAATRGDRRGRGLANALLAEAVRYAAREHETIVLTAGRPDLYARHGFRVVPEVRFVGRVDDGVAGRTPVRAFAWEDAEERARLEDLLAMREPVSRRLAANGDRDVFLFDSARARLCWVDDWEGILWLGGPADRPRVIDVIARRVPTWDPIARALPTGTRDVELCFAPDVVGGPFEEAPPDPEEILMVRGPWPAEGLPVALSPASRC